MSGSIDINKINRALLIKLRHIGDVLLTASSFGALKEARPDASIDALVPAGTEEMLTLNPDIDEVITLDRGAGLVSDLRLLRRIRRKRYDLVINMTEGDRGAIISFFSGARYRIGVDHRRRGLIGKRRMYTHLVRPAYDGRQKALIDMDLLGPLGIASAGPRLSFYTSASDDEAVKAMLAEKGLSEGAPYAVVHPTSRWLFKCWKDEHVAEVIDRLEGSGMRVALTAAPDDRELARVESIISRVKSSPMDFSGALSLKRLGSLIRGASVFFGVDTAPMHMAAALGVPMVALFGPSDYRTWGPLSGSAKVIAKAQEFDCLPCKKDGCGGSKKSRCLDAITVEEALAAISEVMGDKVAG